MPNSETWIWDDMDNDEGPNPGVLIYTLDAGTYTMEIGYREDGALLDAIAVVAVTE
jgi:hypothetical protein